MKKGVIAIMTIVLIGLAIFLIWFFAGRNKVIPTSGLNFWNDEYSFYYSEKPLDKMPTTFEATVRIEDTKDNGQFEVQRAGVIVSNTDTTSSGTFEFGFHDGNRLYFGAIDDFGMKIEKIFTINAETENDSETYITGDWIHVAFVNDIENNEMRAYLDGKLVGTLEGACKGKLTPSIRLCIGGDYRERNKHCFKGDIRDVALYDAVQSERKIASHRKGVSGKEKGLMAAYQFDLTEKEERPLKVADLSGKVDLSTIKYFYTEAEKEAISPRPEYEFSMAVVGDPQVVTAHSANGNTPYEVDKLFQWIVDNTPKDKRNIKFVFNMGDTTDSYYLNNSEDAEWEAGARAVKLMNGKVPYSLVRGNHDATGRYLKNFSWEEYKDTVSGSYADNMLNTYQKFEVNGIKYMTVNLDFGISDSKKEAKAIIEWANGVVSANPDYNVIVTTHAYLDENGKRLEDQEPGSPKLPQYSMVKDGEDMWQEFVSLHKNIVLVISGHVGSKGEVVMAESEGKNGNKVVELMVNPQTADMSFFNSGYDMVGAVTMLYFSDGGKTVHVENYSVIRDAYFLPSSQFSFTLNQIGK